MIARACPGRAGGVRVDPRLAEKHCRYRRVTTMTDRDQSRLYEAWERLHRTGPEFQGWLSTHGPMAVESLDRHG